MESTAVDYSDVVCATDAELELAEFAEELVARVKAQPRAADIPEGAFERLFAGIARFIEELLASCRADRLERAVSKARSRPRFREKLERRIVRHSRNEISPVGAEIVLSVGVEARLADFDRLAKAQEGLR